MAEMHPVFAGLADINDTRAFGESGDRECFDDLGRLFDQHQKCNLYEVNLLHTHYVVREGEAVVNRFNPAKRMLVGEIRPTEEAQKTLPWSLRLFGDTFIPNQWLAVTTSVAKYDFSHDRQFLAEVGSVLADHNALNRFGVQLRLPFLDPSPGKILMEYIDEEKRTSTLVFVDEEERNAPSIIDTSWIFSRAAASFEADQACHWYNHARCRRICHHGSGGE